MNITIPEVCLVVLIGASGSGKSSFGRKHFLPTEVLSSDFFRGVVSDDENDQTATQAAFEALHYVAGKRLAAGRLTVVDATNVQPESRKGLVDLARRHDVLLAAIVLDVPEAVCQERNRLRPNRDFGPHVVRNQIQQLRRSLRGLEREGFRYVSVLRGEAEIEATTIERQRLWTNRRDDHGPFDIIGDVHGCYDELRLLLAKLGYEVTGNDGELKVTPPSGRKAVFLGDLVDRGPEVPSVLRLVMSMVRDGTALCIPGNHENKLLRKLRGRNVQVTHGLAETLAQLEGEPAAFRDDLARFIDDLVSHYVLDEGRLVVAHAGLKEELQGRSSGRVRSFALYGETTGETDEYGLPVRYNWAAEYRGKAMVVYGHTATSEAEWLNNTICIDTGCVFGGALTALRYPEKQLVSVPATRVYYEPSRPLKPVVEREASDLLDVADLLGKRIIRTRFSRTVTVQAGNAAAAFEVLNRFGVDPRWLIYLPPTMAPCDASSLPDYLEYPEQAFDYFQRQGVGSVICEEKHMGSRGVVIACRNEQAAERRFGVSGSLGVIYTRTGRRFFTHRDEEREILDRIVAAAGRADLWTELGTDWLCLDCEVLPWSVKAQDLIEQQYAPVGAAARASVPEAIAALVSASNRGVDVDELLHRYQARDEVTQKYVESYRRYAMPVTSLDDVRLAPFHLLATEKTVHLDKPHTWHLELLDRLVEVDAGLFNSTGRIEVDVNEPDSRQAAVQWWLELTSAGGEGMVVKPATLLSYGEGGLVQPGVKCRGREYLRIIYGPEYTLPENIERLRGRKTARKSALAQGEFALGMEALERFVSDEPRYKVAECVFAVLALESEPVDPRL